MLWMGTSTQTVAAFTQYFNVKSGNRDSVVKATQFDKDLNIDWYDDDLIGVYYKEDNEDLEAALDEIPTTDKALDQIRAKCAEIGITKANAMFYYKDADLQVAEPSKLYNGLAYLGAFDNR
ncbi:MAG: hypothetical protein EOO60_03480 [Hymenobacter sp.]|nr:MAG: hypothetical protein EOO60_03480 [Hymenobacter sp.]